MNNVLILFASSTGHTEMMAEAMVSYLEIHRYRIVKKSFEFDSIDVKELLDYELVLIGTHSADDGEIPYEAEHFYDELDDIDLNGRLIGVFGSGESFYDVFCESIEIMGDRLEYLGAKLLPSRLKVELEPDEKDRLRCEGFVREVCEMIGEPVES